MGATNAPGSVNQIISNLLGELADSGDIETAAGPEVKAQHRILTPLPLVLPLKATTL